MIAMQYKIVLPEDYNMKIIEQRTLENGYKTDGFKGLLYKFYLVAVNGEGEAIQNEYSPMYLWKNEEGMNEFIFNGFYDNILRSFGWQNINIGIPYYKEFRKNFEKSKYVVEVEHFINKTNNMKNLKCSLENLKILGKVIIYNPDKWKYVEYYFYEDLPNIKDKHLLYKILHISK